MNKDELRIRIIPEDGQVLIETHTDGIVKCKEIQEDALLDCIKNSAMRDYVNSGLLPSDCIHVKSTGKPCISALLVLKNEKSCASLNLRSSSRFYNYALFGVNALIIEAAAFFPAPNARMTVAAPLTASPPA